MPNGYWCYQHGHVKARTNIAVGGLAEEDLVWVKASMDNWDPPDAPLPLPAPELFDAAALTPSAPPSGQATRDTATCPACVSTKQRRKHRYKHNHIWGECLLAPPPRVEGSLPLPAVSQDNAEEEFMALQPEEPEAGDGDPAVEVPSAGMAATLPTSIKKIQDFPHACLTLSEAATWGSPEGSDRDDTDAPPSYADEVVSLTDIDDDWAVHNQSPELFQDLADAAEFDNDQAPASTVPAEEEDAEADDEEGTAPTKSHFGKGHRRRRRRQRTSIGEFVSTAMLTISMLTLGLDDAFSIAASAAETDGPHADLLDRQAFQRLNDEPHKKIYTTQEANKSSGEQLQR